MTKGEVVTYVRKHHGDKLVLVRHGKKVLPGRIIATQCAFPAVRYPIKAEGGLVWRQVGIDWNKAHDALTNGTIIRV